MSAVPSYVNPPTLRQPPGPYSQLAVAGDQVFVAGQVGVAPDGTLADGIRDQTLQAFRNVAAALASQGLTMRHIVRLTIYVVDADELPGFMAARSEASAEHFPEGEFPPSSLLVVQRLARPEMRVEVEATAVRIG